MGRYRTWSCHVSALIVLVVMCFEADWVLVGEAPYNSTVTGQTEYLPVTISFVAAKGCVSIIKPHPK